MIILEVHGRQATEKALQTLEDSDYAFTEIASGQRFTRAKDILTQYPDNIVNLYCTPVEIL